MKRLFVLAVLLILAGGGWFVGSRLYAVHDLAAAARDGDSARLERRVDFPAFRASLKGEVGDVIAERGLPGLDPRIDPRLSKVLARAGADFAIDRFVNPETLGQLVRTGQAGDVTVATHSDEREPVEWRIEGGDLHTFRVTGPEAQGALVFRRDGLGWRLAGIEFE